jgi:alpha-beta hydrolase superfamily lysophospholipase
VRNIPEEIRSSVMRQFVRDDLRKLRSTLARYEAFPNGNDVRGRFIAVHPYTKHSRFPKFRGFLDRVFDELDFSTHTFDMPYHGRSVTREKEKERGRIKSFHRVVNSIRAIIVDVMTIRFQRSLPIVLFGVSGGALAIVRFLEQYPRIQKYIAGVVVISTALEIKQNADKEWVREHPQIAELFLTTMARIYPDWEMGKLPEGDSKDKQEYHGPITADTANQFHRASKAAARDLSKITVPILIIHGENDDVALPSGAKRIYDGISTPEGKKRLVMLQKGDHYVYFEDRTFIEMAKWINEVCPKEEWMKLDHTKNLIDDFFALAAQPMFAAKNMLRILIGIGLRWRDLTLGHWQYAKKRWKELLDHLRNE